MRRQGPVRPTGGSIRGVIRRRLLVNAVVDPDEAAARLPNGVRPRVTPAGTVIGCCLLELGSLRPAPAPWPFGVSLLAAAHRISAEWDDETGASTTGVYVPGRLTTSRLAVAVGGRWFPGVHRPARIDVVSGVSTLSWRVIGGPAVDLTAAASWADDPAPTEVDDPIGASCLAATVGLSPGRSGGLEAVQMAPQHRRARQVGVDELRSAFLDGFATAVPSQAYLMESVDVTWQRAPAPVQGSRVAR